MELWIRSQDKKRLTKATDIRIGYLNKIGWIIEDCDELGTYKTKERALEVLDEISSKIKNRYIVSTTAAIISKNDMAKEYKRLNYLYSGEFIMNEPPFEIKPINNNIIYYEMPKE